MSLSPLQPWKTDHNSQAPTGPVAIVWDSPRTPGSLLVIGCISDATYPTPPEGWTLARQQINNAGMYVWIRESDNGALDSPTFQNGALTLLAWKEFGNNLSPALDQVVSSGSGTVTANAFSTGTTPATTQNLETAIAFHATTGNVNPGATVSNHNNSFNEQIEGVTNRTGVNLGLSVSTKRLTATGTQECTGTPSAVVARQAILVTFKAAGVDASVPILSNPTGSGTSSTTGTHSVGTTKDSGTLYFVLTESATKPSITQIKAGQNHLGAAAVFASSQAIVSEGTKTFASTGLTPSTPAYYSHFYHEDALGNQSVVATAAPYTQPNLAPATPTGLTLEAQYRRVKATWNAASGATGYRLYRDGVKVYEGSVLEAFDTGTTHPDPGLASGITYTYTVSAFNPGGESAQSAGVTGQSNETLKITYSVTPDGTLTNNIVTLSLEDSIKANPTYTPVSSGQKILSSVNDGGFTDPVPIAINIRLFKSKQSSKINLGLKL